MIGARRARRTLHDDDDGLVGDLDGLHPQPEAEVDDRDHLSAEVDDPAHKVARTGHARDLHDADDLPHLWIATP